MTGRDSGCETLSDGCWAAKRQQSDSSTKEAELQSEDSRQTASKQFCQRVCRGEAEDQLQGRSSCKQSRETAGNKRDKRNVPGVKLLEGGSFVI